MSQAINLNELPIQQLQAVRQQLDEEIQVLTRSFAKLRQAQMKFGESIEALRSINSSSENKSLLVPLTNSLYVSGELENSNTVIVDVGTGYYVEKVKCY
jgi:prefoldin alpha subunit